MWTIDEIRRIDLELTSVCNGRCPFCARYLWQVPPRANLDYDVLTKNLTLDFIRQLNYLTICGNFGDVVFYKPFLKVLEHIKKANNKNLVFQLATTAVGHKPEYWEKVANLLSFSKGAYCIFAFDGLQDTHEKYRINIKWEPAMRNMKAFINAGGRAVWQFILFKHNEHQIYEAEKMAKELGCVNFKVKTSRIYNDEFETPTILPVETRCEMPDKQKITCNELIKRKSVYICSDGIVMPCGYSDHRKYVPGKKLETLWQGDMKWIMAFHKWKDTLNLYKHSLEDVLKSPFFEFIWNNYQDSKYCNHMCKTDWGDEIWYGGTKALEEYFEKDNHSIGS